MSKNISVIIPTKNGGEQFRETLGAIFSQEIDVPFEVVVIDSGSTDQTLRICNDFPVRLIQVPPASFSHSSTRNKAISKSTGELCVLTVQDAIPVDRQWLASLVAPFAKNDRIGGVYGRQVSKKDGSGFSRCCKDLWYREWRRDWPQPYEQIPIDPEKWEKATPEEKRSLSRFDNVNSCIRRSVWEQIPFPDVAYGEDVAWAIKVLTSGFSLYWQPEACVYHSHERPLGYELQRSYVDTKSLAVLFSGNTTSMTHEMSRSVINWLIKEAKSYLEAVSKGQTINMEGVDILSEADRVWQIKKQEERRVLRESATESRSNRGLKESLLYYYYGSLAGPRWLRKLCRDFFRQGKFFLRSTREDSSGIGPAVALKLQGIHRSFLNQLLQVHMAGGPQTAGNKQSIRLGSAVMVAGSFLGQYLQPVTVAGENHNKNINIAMNRPVDHQDVWHALDEWYQQAHEDDSAALSCLAELLGNGV